MNLAAFATFSLLLYGIFYLRIFFSVPLVLLFFYLTIKKMLLVCDSAKLVQPYRGSWSFFFSQQHAPVKVRRKKEKSPTD